MKSYRKTHQYGSKTDQWDIILKKALYDADLFTDENKLPEHREKRTNTTDMTDHVISLSVINNNI